MPKKSSKKEAKAEKASETDAKKPEKKALSTAEFEKKVVELAKTGLTSEKIGEALRREGVHPQEHGKKISKILKEKELYVNPDLKNVSAKLERIEKHRGNNKQDKRSLKDRERIFGRLRKLKAYHSK